MMRRTTIFILMTALAALVLSACGGGEETAVSTNTPQPETTEPQEQVEAEPTTEQVEIQKLFVGPEKVECVGEGPQECYQVRENPDDDWQLFYNEIAGFEYEAGYNYEIEVAVTPVEDPPAGGSSLSYSLVRILNKQQAEEMQPEAEEVTWIVGPEKVECVGVAPQQCLQIKENPEDEWQLFYDQIAGFEHEEGHTYVIRVLVEPVENPPADASSLQYTLIEILEEDVVGTSEIESTEAGEITLENTLWSLTTLTQPDGTSSELFPDSKITIQFAEGEFNGSACNQYFGSYELDGSSLTLGPVGSTQMFCMPEEISNQESAYFAQLENVAQYSLDGETLFLLDAEDNAILVYEATEPATLTNTLWEAISYNNGREAVVSVLADTRITAQFGEDGTLAGSAGCNNYTTSYEVDGENITISELIAATLMACTGPDGIMEQEAAYLAALPTAATYTIQGDTLELRTADGALVANYKAAETVSLPGSAWDVVNYNNGNEAVVSVILGSSLTAVFNEDGTLTGSAGCNNYNASYEIDGENITIGPAATTRMFCEQPEGVMEQETQYLAALQTAATYSINGETMEMRTADGAMVAGFVIQGYVPPEIEEVLNNATYSSEFTESGEVTLVNGEYREAMAEDSATELVITAVFMAYGSDADGNPLLATVIVSDPGGSGTFYSLHVMQPTDDGSVVEVAATSLGDRVQLNSVEILNGQITVDMVQSGEADPLCCPTEHVINTYEVQGSELVLVNSQVIEDEE